MREPEVLVRFQPSGRSIQVLRGTPLDEAAVRADVALTFPCGGVGVCGKCRVIVRSGAAEPTTAERRWLSDEELRAGWRLACQTTVAEPTEVVVPAAPSLAEHRILVDSDGSTSLTVDPPILRQFAETPSPGDALAVAVDLGTTTLVGSLVELAAGQRLATSARLNPQTRFGDDVLSRIALVRQNLDALGQLHESIATAIDEMIGELCHEAGAPREQVLEITVAGNTTMQQLFAGIDPSPLGELPFTPSVLESQSLSAAELGVRIHPRGRAYIMPVIGGFVGGDTVAGILATGLGGDCPNFRPGDCPDFRPNENGTVPFAPPHPIHRHRHQRRNRPGSRRPTLRRLDGRGAGVRGSENLMRHARLHRRDRESHRR